MGTDIYILFYAQGLVCIIAGQINLMTYEWLGMKVLVIIAQCVNIVFTTYIILVKTKVFSYEDPEQEELFMAVSMPIALFFVCTAIQVGFTAVVQSAY